MTKIIAAWNLWTDDKAWCWVWSYWTETQVFQPPSFELTNPNTWFNIHHKRIAQGNLWKTAATIKRSMANMRRRHGVKIKRSMQCKKTLEIQLFNSLTWQQCTEHDGPNVQRHIRWSGYMRKASRRNPRKADGYPKGMQASSPIVLVPTSHTGTNIVCRLEMVLHSLVAEQNLVALDTCTTNNIQASYTGSMPWTCSRMV